MKQKIIFDTAIYSFGGMTQMAGFFGLFDFTKEGKGVDPNEPKAPTFIRFFQYYGRNFFKMILTNLIYILFNLPILILTQLFVVPLTVMFATNTSISDIIPKGEGFDILQNMGEAVANGTITSEGSALIAVLILMMIFFAIMPMLTFGPAYAGMTYITRNIARDVPSFTWSDFLHAFKRNWKKSTVFMLINAAMTMLISICYGFYIAGMEMNQGFFYTFGVLMTTVVMIVYLCMTMYIYPMIVTFDFNIRTIIKNAFSLTVLRFGYNILTLAICFIVALAIYCCSLAEMIVLLILLFGPVTVSYIMNTNAWIGIEKYIVIPAEKCEGYVEPIFKD